MNKRKMLHSLKTKPFRLICLILALSKVLKCILFLCQNNPFFNPFIVWEISSAFAYFILISMTSPKRLHILFLFYVFETCTRICFTFFLSKCDPRYEILLISLFIICFFFTIERNEYKFINYLFASIVLFSIFYSFYFKFRFYKSFYLFSAQERFFTAIEIFCNLIITFMHIIIVAFSTSTLLSRIRIQTLKTQKELEYVRCHDILTGLMNRYRAAFFFSTCETHKAKVGTDYGIAILDIDDFKKINDTYGHDAGDFILKNYTRELRQKLPMQNKIARWGGEEFLIIYPKITSETVFELDTIRKLIALTPFQYNNSFIHVTATYGISSSRNLNSAYEVLSDADKHLLIGKQNGKNRLVVSQNF